jgi:hypothetical protein
MHLSKSDKIINAASRSKNAGVIPIGVRPDYVERLSADRPGSPENGDILYTIHVYF